MKKAEIKNIINKLNEQLKKYPTTKGYITNAEQFITSGKNSKLRGMITPTLEYYKELLNNKLYEDYVTLDFDSMFEEMTWEEKMEQALERNKRRQLEKYLESCNSGAEGVCPMPEVVDKLRRN